MKLQIRFNILALLLVAICNLKAFSQAADYSKGWGDLNYAVPETPAFKILDVSPSNIMRPSATRDIAISIGQYYLQNGATLPKNFAVEISPMLFHPKVSLKDYKDKRLWYTATAALGTKQNTDGSYAVSAGFRIKLVDKTDLHNDVPFINYLNANGPNLANQYNSATDIVANDLAAKNRTTYAAEMANIAAASAARAAGGAVAKAQQALNAAVDKVQNQLAGDDAANIDAFRNTRKEALWNAFTWDLGGAAMFFSKDSLIGNISGPTKIGLWTTIGLPVTKKGQFLLGINGQLKDSLNKSLKIANLNVGGRLYYGSNDFKGFLEGELIYETYSQPVYRANIGIETTFFGGLWFNLSLGIKKMGDGNPAFTQGFNLYFANPVKS